MGEECAKYRVRLCSKCPRDTEYVCEPCNSYLCYNCKEAHFKNLNHDGYIDRKKSKQVYCGIHSGKVSKMFCVKYVISRSVNSAKIFVSTKSNL